MRPMTLRYCLIVDGAHTNSWCWDLLVDDVQCIVFPRVCVHEAGVVTSNNINGIMAIIATVDTSTT